MYSDSVYRKGHISEWFDVRVDDDTHTLFEALPRTPTTILTGWCTKTNFFLPKYHLKSWSFHSRFFNSYAFNFPAFDIVCNKEIIALFKFANFRFLIYSFYYSIFYYYYYYYSLQLNLTFLNFFSLFANTG